MLGLARRYAGLPGVPDARCGRRVLRVAAVGRPAAGDQAAVRASPGRCGSRSWPDAIGFSWRDPEPGGENSMAWYRAAVATTTASADPATGTRDGRQRVVRYNEDDVLATLAVRRWISGHLDELPTVAELRSPTR